MSSEGDTRIVLGVERRKPAGDRDRLERDARMIVPVDEGESLGQIV
jgi:hypothetical protein